jgi:hypothetical protein
MNAGYRMASRRPFKRMHNHQQGQCIQMCKQDESCRSMSVDYSTGTCEFYDDPQQNEQLSANLLGLGARLAKRSVDKVSNGRPIDAGRRIVARLNVSDLNLESEFPPLDDDSSNDDIGPDGEAITFLPEPAFNPVTPTHHNEAPPSSSSSLAEPISSTINVPSKSTAIPTSTIASTVEPAIAIVAINSIQTSTIASSLAPTFQPVKPTVSQPILVSIGTSSSSSSAAQSQTSPGTSSSQPETWSTAAPSILTETTSRPVLTITTGTRKPPLTPTKFTAKPSSSSTQVANNTSLTNQFTIGTLTADKQPPSSDANSQQGEATANRPEMNVDLEPCAHCAHFTKVCLNELNSCGTDWTFEVTSGFTLKASFRPEVDAKGASSTNHFLSERIVSAVSNRADCQSECLKANRLNGDRLQSGESQFVCRSVVFNALTRSCRLNSYTRHSTYGRFARLVPSHNSEYMENNCLMSERGFCTWKSQRRLRLQFADRVSREANLTACQDRCSSSSNFYCRSVSFEPSSGVCALSHHSGRSLSDQLLMLKASPDAIFSEIGNCFSGTVIVSLQCPCFTQFHINLIVIRSFGQLWSDGNDCQSQFSGLVSRTSLCTRSTEHLLRRCSQCNRISFTNSINRLRLCDQTSRTSNQFFLFKSVTVRSFPSVNVAILSLKTEQPEADFTNVLVIQANNQVLTSVDKAIGLKCSYNVHNITGEAVLQFR